MKNTGQGVTENSQEVLAEYSNPGGRLLSLLCVAIFSIVFCFINMTLFGIEPIGFEPMVEKSLFVKGLFVLSDLVFGGMLVFSIYTSWFSNAFVTRIRVFPNKVEFISSRGVTEIDRADISSYRLRKGNLIIQLRHQKKSLFFMMMATERKQIEVLRSTMNHFTEERLYRFDAVNETPVACSFLVALVFGIIVWVDLVANASYRVGFFGTHGFDLDALKVIGIFISTIAIGVYLFPNRIMYGSLEILGEGIVFTEKGRKEIIPLDQLSHFSIQDGYLSIYKKDNLQEPAYHWPVRKYDSRRIRLALKDVEERDVL